MSDSLLIDEPAEGVKRITINRPEATNAFQFEMYAELADLFRQIKYDPRVRVVWAHSGFTVPPATSTSARATTCATPARPTGFPKASASRSRRAIRST